MVMPTKEQTQRSQTTTTRTADVDDVGSPHTSLRPTLRMERVLSDLEDRYEDHLVGWFTVSCSLRQHILQLLDRAEQRAGQGSAPQVRRSLLAHQTEFFKQGNASTVW